MEILINAVGLLIIDTGAILYGKNITDNHMISFVFFLICNCVGGLLYRYQNTKNVDFKWK